MLADFALLIEGSLFLIGYLNLPPIYVSSRKHIAPQKWRAKVNELEEKLQNCTEKLTKTHRNKMLKIWNVYRRNTINYMIILLKVLFFVLVQPGMKKVKKITNIF